MAISVLNPEAPACLSNILFLVYLLTNQTIRASASYLINDYFFVVNGAAVPLERAPLFKKMVSAATTHGKLVSLQKRKRRVQVANVYTTLCPKPFDDDDYFFLFTCVFF